MNDMDIGTDENDKTVIVIDDQNDITDGHNEPSMNEQLNIKPSEIKYIDQIPLPSTAENIDNERRTLRRNNRRLVEGTIQQKESHNTTPITVVQEHRNPLVEYAEEPLLPLMEACTPLLNIIHNLPEYIQLVLKETPRRPSDGLTYDESAAIRLYTIEWNEPYVSLYTTLNSILKNNDQQALRPFLRYLKLLLTALVKLPCAPLQTVWRGVNKDLSKEFSIGTPIIWWSFSSCTTSLTVLKNNMYLSTAGDRTLFSVEAINGRIIRSHSHFDFEDEILLLPGTYMEVQSQLSPASGLHIIHLKQIKPKETLLALPFEDALLYPPEKVKVPWYKNKRTIVELTLIICLCIAGIIVGAVLGTRRPPPPPICYTRPVPIPSDLFWSFDCSDAREEIKGIDNGTAENGANYSLSDFSGQGRALNLNRKLNEYVNLPHSLNLTLNTSFTVSMWIFSTGYNWATILSDCSPISLVCIDFYLYSIYVYAKTLDQKNLNILYGVRYNGWQDNYQSAWIHLAFIFDFKNSLLAIYFNGARMVEGHYSPNDVPKTATNETATSFIGFGSLPDSRYPFDGLIDQLSVSYYVKNDSEILNEATLLCSYNFDSDNVNVDSGPNNIPAYTQNINRSLSNGESSLLLNATDAYFQSSGFTLLKSKFYEFTIAFWIRLMIGRVQSDPSNSAMAILQLASKVEQVSSESYVCFLSLLIANASTNKPYFRFDFGQLNMFIALDWLSVKNNTWTHVAITYSGGSKLFFYFNGVSYPPIDDTRFSLLLYDPRLAVTIGGNYFDDMISNKTTNYESRKCFAENPQFNFTQMYGEIDNVKIFARALNDSDIATLAVSKKITN